MILAQKNIFVFYDAIGNRQWDFTENRYNSIVVLPTLTIPQIQLIMDTDTYANLDVCDPDGTFLFEAVDPTMVTETGYKRMKYAGGSATGLTEGYYCLKVTTNLGTYISDVFEWRDDVSLDDLIKIEATSSNFSLGVNKDYVIDMTSFTFSCYLKLFDYLGLITETEELAREANGVIFPYYTGTATSESWIINGNKHIYKFLSSLRLLQQNGVVTITWRGEARTAMDIMVEINRDHGYFDLVDIEIKIKPSNEVVTVINKTV